MLIQNGLNSRNRILHWTNRPKLAEEFREERGWAPGMCTCIGDYEWYQEQYEEALAHIESKPGPLTRIVVQGNGKQIVGT